MRFDIYTDGACDNGPQGGPGAYAAVILTTDRDGVIYQETPVVETIENATSMECEIRACVLAFRSLPDGNHRVTLYTDSRMVIDAMTDPNAPRQNYYELWLDLYYAQANHRVKWVWIPGHGKADDQRHADYNHKVDLLAVRAKYELMMEVSGD